MSDLTLFPDLVEPEPAPTLQERFEAFDRANPAVRRELVRLARDLRARGHRRIGIGLLFEVLRWQSMLATTDPDGGWKLNNSLRSRYARSIAETCPDLADAFEMRELVSQ